MNDVILKVLIRLFAIISNLSKDRITDTTLNEMREYLTSMLNSDDLEEYWKLFNYWLNHYKRDLESEAEDEKLKINNAFKHRVDSLCEQINQQLNSKQKIFILIQILEYLKVDESKPIEEIEYEFISLVAKELLIDSKDFDNINNFILKNLDEVPDSSRLLIVSGEKPARSRIKHITKPNMGIGFIHFLFIKTTNTFIFKYQGEHNLYLNSTRIIQNKIHFFSIGSYIGSSRIRPIYYRNVADKFMKHLISVDKFVFRAQRVTYKFKDGNIGVTDFSLNELSGNMIGILGGSGVGKSTLLNVLNGSLKPQKGKVTINGFDIHNNQEATEGLIGFVPQDDLLFESLTVYENLLYNAKLCFNNHTEEEIEKIINTTIKSFRLTEARDLIVGDPINKVLSGGQRKRLNIALEVMRDPLILFVDEPTSGLSSVDSEYIINILKRQTLLGRLVFANIHQPSSDIFKQFDKLIVLDEEGTIIYYGNPVDALVYFREITHHVNASERECPTCQNVRVEQILRIVEARTVDEAGRRTRERKTSAKKWHTLYKKHIWPRYKSRRYNYKNKLKSSLEKPSKLEQLKIFMSRDLNSKKRNFQFVLFSFILSPILAFLLSYFTKKNTSSLTDFGQYIYADNDYIPGYIFMSIIVALFVGLMASAEDIIKDRKIRQREKFLNLSWKSYVNAKIINLIMISLVQSFLFVLIGNTILEIPGMFFKFWLMLFACFSLSNLIGLNLSASLKSIVSIYILIPAVIVPQLLFGGMIVDYNKHYTNIVDKQKVPISAEMFSSKSAYEALMVCAYKENQFNKYFYKTNKEQSETEFANSYVAPALRIKVAESATSDENLQFINNEINRLEKLSGLQLNFEITKDNLSKNRVQIIDFIDKAKSKLITKNNSLISKKDSIYNALVDKYGQEYVDKLKSKNHNSSIETILMNATELVKIVETNTNYVQISNPIYRNPNGLVGRTHLFAPSKKFFGITLSTYTYNLLSIVLRIIFWTLMLYYNVLSKSGRRITYISKRVKRLLKARKLSKK
jgi:ABC-type multidrug transport system ATPase subunit